MLKYYEEALNWYRQNSGEWRVSNKCCNGPTRNRIESRPVLSFERFLIGGCVKLYAKWRLAMECNH